MIVTADIGNSHVRFAFFESVRDRAPRALLTVSSRTDRTRDELAATIAAFAERNGIATGRNADSVDGCVIGSVVPALTALVAGAIADALSPASTVTVRHGLKTGLDIRTDYQTELGADIVANAVGARSLVKPPFAVVDLGTATTLSLVDEKDCFRGVAIMPGLSSSARALAAECAALPHISVDSAGGAQTHTDKPLLGKNTADSLASGLIVGIASMVDGMLLRVGEEYDCADALTTVVCGGGADTVFPYLRQGKHMLLCPELTSLGLLRLWELNSRR